jgi:mono/diheme cytochrome c family protein
MRQPALSFIFLLVVAPWLVAGLPHELVQAGDIGHNPPSGDSKRGEDLYRVSCSVCHGVRAAGNIGPRLVGNAILSNDAAFWKIVYEGRHVMPPLKGAVSHQQMADIRAWLQTLR